jgi:hypothetical protein
MDTKELKKVLKPLIKETIKEVLIEQGLLKMLTEALEPENETEVVKETKVVAKQPIQKQIQPQKQPPKLNESQKKSLEAIKKSGYVNKQFNPFEGTEPLKEGQASGTGRDLADPGVSIDGLMDVTGNKWKAILERTEKGKTNVS